jgi:transposase
VSIVTEHRAHRCLCATCGTVTQAAFPETINAPVQYGARIAASIVYLTNFQFIPEDRLATLMADLFDVHLSCATIAQMSSRAAQRLQPFADAVKDLVISAPVKHLDETGFRIGGRTKWLHVAATRALTFYRVSPKRGELLAGVSGIVVHDHWKPYYTMKGVLHALCDSHHLRELQALRDIEHEDWAPRIQTLLRRACHASNLARAKATTLNQRLVGLIERRYDAIVAEGIGFHEAQTALATKPKKDGTARKGRPPRRVGHNLLLRLSGRKADVLRFTTKTDVPFTNTEAEQAVRMMKVKQKVSGGFRTDEEAKEFSVIRTMIATARKKGGNIITSLLQDAQSLIRGLSST